MSKTMFKRLIYDAKHNIFVEEEAAQAVSSSNSHVANALVGLLELILSSEEGPPPSVLGPSSGVESAPELQAQAEQIRSRRVFPFLGRLLPASPARATEASQTTGQESCRTSPKTSSSEVYIEDENEEGKFIRRCVVQ